MPSTGLRLPQVLPLAGAQRFSPAQPMPGKFFQSAPPVTPKQCVFIPRLALSLPQVAEAGRGQKYVLAVGCHSFGKKQNGIRSRGLTREAAHKKLQTS